MKKYKIIYHNGEARLYIYPPRSGELDNYTKESKGWFILWCKYYINIYLN